MAAGLVAFAIMFGMCGARLNFAIPWSALISLCVTLSVDPALPYSLIRVADAEDHRDRGRWSRARHKACCGAEPMVRIHLPPPLHRRESANFWFPSGGAPRYWLFASGPEAAAQTPAHNFRRDTVADEIVIVGKDSDGHGYVLADLSGRYFPGHRHLNPPSALADKFGVLWMVYVGE